MDEASRLIPNRVHHSGGSVAGHRHAKSPREVQKDVPIHVPNVGPFGFLPEHREVGGEVGDVSGLDPGETLSHLQGARPRGRTLDPGQETPEFFSQRLSLLHRIPPESGTGSPTYSSSTRSGQKVLGARSSVRFGSVRRHRSGPRSWRASGSLWRQSVAFGSRSPEKGTLLRPGAAPCGTRKQRR